MIDVISGEEPPIELGDNETRNFGVPHPVWFLTTVALQLVVLFFLGASKINAMPKAKIVKVQALTGYVSHDKFRGNYITDVILNADSARVLPRNAKDVVLVFKADKTVSALDGVSAEWKFARVGCNSEKLSSSEVALKATVSASRFTAGKQMISIHTSPFFVAEGVATSLGLRDFGRTPLEFELAVDKEGHASIVSIDTANWLSSKALH